MTSMNNKNLESLATREMYDGFVYISAIIQDAFVITFHLHKQYRQPEFEAGAIQMYLIQLTLKDRYRTRVECIYTIYNQQVVRIQEASLVIKSRTLPQYDTRVTV